MDRSGSTTKQDVADRQLVVINQLLGHQLGNYEIKAKLDQGAFGIVYTATNVNTLEKAIVKFTLDYESYMAETSSINKVQDYLKHNKMDGSSFVKIIA